MKISNYKAILILLFALLFTNKISAQGLNETAINQQTYSQYINANWNGLIKTANKALKAKIDFYYLRTRIGIAYFETGKYGSAIQHFEKAQAIAPDDVIREYLYFSYLYAGKMADAGKMAAKMPFDLKRKLELEGKLQSIGIGFYNNAVDNYESLIVDDLNSTYEIGGKQTILKNRTSTKLNFQTRNKTGISKFSYSYLHSTNLLRLEEPMDSVAESEGKVNQHNLGYLQTIALNSYLNLYAGINVLTGMSQSIVFVPGSSSGGFGGGFTLPGYILSNDAYSDLQLLSGLGYKSAYFDVDLNLAYLRFGGNNNVQIEIQPTIYPFTNMNLYISPSYIKKLDADGGSLAKIKAGFGLLDKVWIEAGLWTGEISYFSSNLGQFIYNGDEIFESKKFVNIIVPIKNKDIFISYESISSNLPYEFKTGFDTTDKTYQSFNSSLIYAGIKFKY